MTLTLSQLSAFEIAAAQSAWTAAWHDAPTEDALSPFMQFVEKNHRMNFDLWHEEDVARRDDIGAERIREAKRFIDKTNQQRNNAMEQMDELILSCLPEPDAATPQHSETPGMIIDRLSILSLKIYHMQEQAERTNADEAHRATCQSKLEQLGRQRADLTACLNALLQQLEAGTRCFRIYRQFKMYNDPTLNPQLYAARPGSNG